MWSGNRDNVEDGAAGVITKGLPLVAVVLSVAFCSWSASAAEAAVARDQLRLVMMKGAPQKWELDANFAVFLRRLDEACAQRAEMFVTPECWLDGYAAADKASTVERLRGVAQDVTDSAYLKRVAEEARSRKVFICFGYTSLEAGKIYNASGVWDDSGRLLGIYHKTHLQTHDLQFSPGEALPCWPTPWGPVGIMICADRRWPETARVLRLQGARLILNPSYGMCREANECWMRTRGYENQCFVAFVHPKVDFLVNPSGNIAAKHAEGDPDTLAVDLDLTQAKEDHHLRDRRPDLYGIIVAPKSSVSGGEDTKDK